MTSGDWLLGADLIGVAVFAASGASAGIAKRLDLFGVAFAGFIAALGGGILRDVVIGSVPPLASRATSSPARSRWSASATFSAPAALIGAILVTVLREVGLADQLTMGVSALLITGVRRVAPDRRWSAPVAAP